MALPPAASDTRTDGAAVGSGVRWPVAWGAITLALGSLPYLLAWARTPAGYVFSGLLVHPADGFSYLAKMRQGLEGAWLFTLPYGTEAHQPAPIYCSFLLLGHVARWTGLPLIAVYHAARLVAGALLLMAFWRLLGLLCPDGRSRRWAFAVGCLGAGLGWLVLPLGLTTPDLTVPEGSVFFAFFANPHFPAALAAFAGAISFTARALDRASVGWTMAAALCGCAMATIHPHLLLPLAVLVTTAGAGARKTAGALRPLAQVGCVLAAASLPAAVQVWALLTDPVLAVWAAQNRTPSPSLGDFLLGLGAPGALAAVGGIMTLWRPAGGIRHRGTMLAVAWLALTVILLYAPLAFQRRYYEGLQFPVAALAGTTLVRLLDRGRAARLVTVALLAAAAPSTLLNATLPVLGSAQAPEPVYLPTDDRVAYDWLAQQATARDVLLAGPVHGNQVPAYAPVRVIWGHPFETVDSAAKLDALRQFYGDPRSDAAAALAARERVTLVYLGDEERRMMPPGGATVPGTVVYQYGTVTILRVAHPAP